MHHNLESGQKVSLISVAKSFSDKPFSILPLDGIKAHHSVTSSILVTSKLKYPEGKRGTLQEKICFAYMTEYNTTVYMQQPKAREVVYNSIWARLFQRWITLTTG